MVPRISYRGVPDFFLDRIFVHGEAPVFSQIIILDQLLRAERPTAAFSFTPREIDFNEKRG
jgi:hypothetical protein